MLPTDPKKIKIVCSLHNLFLKNLLLNQRKIALQYCVGFCHTTMQISHKYTYIISLLSLLPLPHSIPLSHHRAPSWAYYMATSRQISILHMVVHTTIWYLKAYPKTLRMNTSRILWYTNIYFLAFVPSSWPELLNPVWFPKRWAIGASFILIFGYCPNDQIELWSGEGEKTIFCYWKKAPLNHCWDYVNEVIILESPEIWR